MTGYFVRRFLLIIPTFIGITLAVFLVMNFVPGGPVERQIMRYKMAMANEGGVSGGAPSVEIPEDAIQEMRRYYGFDKPVYTRYVLWLWKVLHLDLGRSYIYQDPVWDVIKARFPVSLFLGLTGFFLSYLVCIPLGVFKAIRHGSRFDLLEQSGGVSRVFDPRLGAGNGAAGASGRGQFLERVSSWRISPRPIGNTSVFSTRSRRKFITCFFPCCAT